MNRKLYLIYWGSLLSQTVQLGCFPILISQILDSKGTAGSVIGLLIAIPWLAVLVLGPLVPSVIDQVGGRGANLISCVLSGLAIFFIIASENLFILAGASILMGAGLIIRWVNCDTLVIELSDEGSSGRSIGIHEALMGLGLAIGPLLFALVSLQNVKFICILTLCLGAVGFWLVADTAKPSEDSEKVPFLKFYKIIFVALIAAFTAGFIESTSTALLPLHFSQFEITLSASAILVSSFGLGGTLLQPPLGLLADRVGYLAAQLSCAVVALFGCLVFVLFATDYAVLLVSLFVFGGAIGGLNTLAVMQAGKTLNDKTIPSAMTTIAMVYTLGGVVGPVASGATMAHWDGFGMIAVFAAISLALVGALVGTALKGKTIQTNQ